MPKDFNEKEFELSLKENEKLIFYLCNKYYSTQIEYEDLLSIAKYGYYKAYITFNESKEVKFTTYAANVINTEILMEIRNKKRHNKVDSLCVSYNQIVADDIELLDSLIVNKETLSIEDQIINKQVMQRALYEINKLPEEQKLLMKSILQGIPAVRIAKTFNKSISWASSMKFKIIKKLQRDLKKEHYI